MSRFMLFGMFLLARRMSDYCCYTCTIILFLVIVRRRSILQLDLRLMKIVDKNGGPVYSLEK